MTNTFLQALNELPNDIVIIAKRMGHELKSKRFWGVIGRGLFIFAPYITLSYVLEASLYNGSMVIPIVWVCFAMAVILKEQEIKDRRDISQ